MSKYIIEGNINFQEELHKLLNEESDDEDECCQISGLPLKDKFIKLECKHLFNYDALYKEIYRQKYNHKRIQLSESDFKKCTKSNLDYFIKCPYCRNIQFTILPYYEDLGLEKIYGINSLDKTLPNTISTIFRRKHKMKEHSLSYYDMGLLFELGNECKHVDEFGNKCICKYVCYIPNTQLSYCQYHYKLGLINYKISEKKKEYEKISSSKKAKIEERNKLLELHNFDRALKGLGPLKRLSIKRKENIVKQVKKINNCGFGEDLYCKAILKTGLNKGKVCGCKKVQKNKLCKRHLPKDEINDELKICDAEL